MAGKTLRSLIIPFIGDVGPLANSIAMAERKLGQFARTAERIGHDLSKKITAPLVAAGAASLKLAADFEATTATIEGLVGASSEQLAKYDAQILEMAPRLGKSPKELKDAMYFITSAGLEGKDALDALEVSAKASAAGMGETKTMADALSTVMKDYGPANMSAAKAGDIFTGMIRAAKSEAVDFAPILGHVVPKAAEMGVRFEEVAAALATMNQKGLPAAEAATALAGILNSLNKPAKEAEKTLGLVGLTAEGLRQQLREKGLLSVLETLKEKFHGNQTALAHVITDTQGFNGALMLVGQSAGDTKKIFQDMNGTAGLLDKGVDAVSKTFNFKLNQAIAASQVLFIELGKNLLPMATEAVIKINAGIQDLTKWWVSLSKEEKDSIIRYGLIAGAIGPAVVAIGKVSWALKSLISYGPIFLRFCASMETGFLLVLGPGAPVALGLAALSAGILLLAGRWSDGTHSMQKDFEDLGNTVARVSNNIFDSIYEAHAWLYRDNLVKFGKAASDHTIQTFKSAGDRTREFFERSRKEAGLFTEVSIGSIQQFGRAYGDVMGRAALQASASMSQIQVSSKTATESQKFDLAAVEAAHDQAEAAADLRRETEAKNRKDALKQEQDDHLKSKRKMLDDLIIMNKAKSEATSEYLAEDKAKWEQWATQVSEAVVPAFEGIWAAITQGGKAFDGILVGMKRWAISFISTLQAKLIATKVAEIATAKALGTFSFGASLLAIPGILGAVGPGLLALEAAKAGIAGLAEGGRIMRSGMVMVGERGPELLNLPTGAQVTPLTGGAGAAFGGAQMMTLVMEIDGRRMAEAVMPYQRGVVRAKAGTRR